MRNPELSRSVATENFLLNFREYFYSRGNLIYEPPQDDDSFSSQPDDFDDESSSEYQKLSNSSTNSSNEIEKIINRSKMSDSLLFCLDGNKVETSPSSPSSSRKRPLDESLKEDESMKRPLLDEDFTDL